MGQRVVYVLTHDSIFLGEDGPTHQPIEHAMALRLIPGMTVFRPADGAETAGAWLAALRHTEGPSCLLLTRQGLPQVVGPEQAYEGVAKGGYVVRAADAPDLILIGTGSELQLCLNAADTLSAEGLAVRVVSMPSIERFLAQPQGYRDQVLAPECGRRLSVEAGRTWGWEVIVGSEGMSLGIDSFGASAPASDLARTFGMTTEAVVSAARSLAAR